MYAHVDVEVIFRGDFCAAHGAHERLLARVHPLVRRQRLRRVEPSGISSVKFERFGDGFEIDFISAIEDMTDLVSFNGVRTKFVGGAM